MYSSRLRTSGLRLVRYLCAGCLLPISQVFADCSAPPYISGLINQQRLLADLHMLGDDWMQGRRTGTTGSKRAQRYIASAFDSAGLLHFSPGYLQPFTFSQGPWDRVGINLVGWQRGITHPHSYMVITAHYDHLGKLGGRIYNGADDNASGVAAMLAIARHLQRHPPRLSVVYLATDAEELGLHGSQAFIDDLPVPLEQIKFGLNIDMVSQGGRQRRLYVAGMRKQPLFDDIAEEILNGAQLCLKAGRDGRTLRLAGRRGRDWRESSDHAIFFENEIPFLFFGVNEHRFYHSLADTPDKINTTFYTAAVETVLRTLLLIDERSLLE